MIWCSYGDGIRKNEFNWAPSTHKRKTNVFRLSRKSIFNELVRYVAGICEELPVFFDAEFRRTEFI